MAGQCSSVSSAFFFLYISRHHVLPISHWDELFFSKHEDGVRVSPDP